ncbi:kirola isoform X2 [Nicotiana tabacum]|uniref:Kirola isoform X2 n=2 Tax=Nicotiana TaxID=4085 RepID=A0A1S4DIN1_TOBAC|nr:PREDICTED: kirola-like isoform X2 [Nicotiana sylvestris]XP_016513222.1 PREDICTED: kirola-like isoform X2 [Nicotiana tabacum]
MGIKGKLIASMEVKSERLVRLLAQNITKMLMIIDGREKFIKHTIEATDPQKKSVTWKVIEGDLLELYNSFTIVTSIEDQWITWTFVYEKKTEDTPEPLAFMGVVLDMTKDVEGHLLKK